MKTNSKYHTGIATNFPMTARYCKNMSWPLCQASNSNYASESAWNCNLTCSKMFRICYLTLNTIFCNRNLTRNKMFSNYNLTYSNMFCNFYLTWSNKFSICNLICGVTFSGTGTWLWVTICSIYQANVRVTMHISMNLEHFRIYTYQEVSVKVTLFCICNPDMVL